MAGDVRVQPGRETIRGMVGRQREDPDVLHRHAQVAILSGLAGGDEDVFELMTAVVPYDVRGLFTPDVALLEVAAAALGLACPPGGERLEYERRGRCIRFSVLRQPGRSGDL